mgnify:CR=1 FL=1
MISLLNESVVTGLSSRKMGKNKVLSQGYSIPLALYHILIGYTCPDQGPPQEMKCWRQPCMEFIDIDTQHYVNLRG